jgi:hypothetical protein
MPFLIVWAEKQESLKTDAQEALTRAQACAALGLVSERALNTALARGDLSPCPERIGNVQLFLANDVEELRQSRLKRDY